jgi:hypothetical protein
MAFAPYPLPRAGQGGPPCCAVSCASRCWPAWAIAVSWILAAIAYHVGTEAAGMMRAPFVGPDSQRLRYLLQGAGFDRTEIRIGLITVRFPSPQEFLRQEAASSPLAEPVGALDDRRRDALIAHLDVALVPYMDDEGVVFPMQTWLAMAVR